MSYRRNQAIIEDMNYANDRRVRATGWPGGFDSARMTITYDLDLYLTLEDAHERGFIPEPTKDAYMDMVFGPEPPGYDPEMMRYTTRIVDGKYVRVEVPQGPWRNEDNLDFDVRDGTMVYHFEEVPTPLPATFEVCSICGGQGSHTNPSIDCGGLTSEDFDRDPDFYEEYVAGTYDQECNGCQGRRVEPVVDRERCEREGLGWVLKVLDDRAIDEANDHAERMAEMRMGC